MPDSTMPAAPAPVVSTSTAAPAPTVTTATPAPATTTTAEVRGELGTQKFNLRQSYVPPAAASPLEKPALSPEAVKAVEATAPAPTVEEVAKKAEAERPADPAPAVAKAAEVDDIAQALATLNRETRAARTAQEKAKAEGTRLADKVAAAERLEKAQEALKGKDFASALRSLDPDLNVDEAILTLLDQASKLDAKPLTEADIERIAVAKIEADRAAAQEKAKAESAAALERAALGYAQACAAEFNPDAFPLVGALGVSDTQIREYTEQVYARDRAIPSPAETLKYFEQAFEAKLTRAGYSRAQIAAVKENQRAQAAAPAPAAPPPPSASVGSLMSVAAADTGGAPGTPPRKLTLAEEVKARRAAIVQAAQAR